MKEHKPTNLAHTVSVAVDIPVFKTFSYLSADWLKQGQRVAVPFGPRILCGIVTTPHPDEPLDPELKLKAIAQQFDELPPLPQDLLALIEFSAKYYHYPYGQTLFTALPTRLRQPRPVSIVDERSWTLSEEARQQPSPPKHHRVQYALWQALSQKPCTKTDIEAFGQQARKIFNKWQNQAWLQHTQTAPSPFYENAAPALTAEQQEALTRISNEPVGAPWILFGVTGSGKTEVYLQLIAQTLRARQQVLVLVPEINLTPQLIARFTQRFPHTPVRQHHSQLTENARFSSWLAAWQGQAGIILGTRLAIFTPFNQLGLIIVDEEHDPSFKQQDGLRYHARDLAVWRAHKAQIPIVLGSATPSLESLNKLREGRYRCLNLTQRAHASARLPQIELIDMRHNQAQEGLSEQALDALQQTIQRQELSLVYINRRGFAPVLACLACAWRAGCTQCSSQLVVHLSQRLLCCHHCGKQQAIVPSCPRCGNLDLTPLGAGTQRLEQALSLALPQARIARIDRDTTQSQQAWDQLYQALKQEKLDIIVGTQMLAKGHDFATLSLVLILNADAALYSADYRATERLLAQLLQVSGRAGRADKPGRVLLQTRWPEHPLYHALKTHDYAGYAQHLLKERDTLGLPPARFQAIIRAEARALEQALVFLQRLRRTLEPLAHNVQLFGPSPALMLKLANRERAQLILESSQRPSLHALLQEATTQLSHQNSRVRWSLEVD